MLKRRGIKHNVLNAKFHEMEAEIVAQAGIHDAVTIASNGNITIATNIHNITLEIQAFLLSLGFIFSTYL